MFHWLTGPPAEPNDIGERTTDTLVDGFDNAPETPAPVFAVRAFKQAIFGTPKPEEVKDQRIRDVPRRREQSQPFRAIPAVNETQTQSNKHHPPSPSRRPGILLTPGTERNRRKSVAFGAGHHAPPQPSFSRKESTTATRSTYQFGASAEINEARHAERAASKKAALSAIRAETEGSQTKEKAEKCATPDSELGEMTLDVPLSSSGRYWKGEFDSFSSKSTLELRKLAKREQIAKKFAKQKDSEALKLSEMLRREQHKVTELEEQVQRYVAQLSTAAGPLLSKTSETEVNRKHLIHQHTAEPEEDVASLRATIQRQKAELDEASKTIEALRQTNSELETTLKELRPKSEDVNPTTKFKTKVTNTDSTLQSTQSRGRIATRDPPRRKRSSLGSDIWADGSATGKSETEQALKSLDASRSVLTESAGNVRPLRAPSNGKTSLPNDRLEAARQRLAAKRNR